MAKHKTAIQVGRALRARRQAAGLSQGQFADSIDMHRPYYAAIERGEKKITLKTLSRLADGLGVPISEILQDIDK
jgi:transcriptional regulator with XRE-family HTH domain